MNKKQISDAYYISILLVIVGGFLDTYTYLCRGQVFANTQTGNTVLLGVKLITGNISGAITYIWPILAFIVGVFIAETIRKIFLQHHTIHWRQIVIGFQILILFAVSFLSQEYNSLCTSLVSFVCGLQLQSFRKFEDNPYASTMCTGNLRTGTELFYMYTQTKEKKTLYKSLQYYTIILFFILGACLGVISIHYLADYALFVAIVLLLIIVFIMNLQKEV